MPILFKYNKPNQNKPDLAPAAECWRDWWNDQPDNVETAAAIQFINAVYSVPLIYFTQTNATNPDLLS